MEEAIAIIATLDTKEEEVEYCKSKIEEMGVKALVVDSSLRGKPKRLVPDMSREEVAKAIGYTTGDLEKESKIVEMEKVSEGLAAILFKLYTQGKLRGVISIGGHDGAILAGKGMRTLPIGVPKLIVTTLAGLSVAKDVIYTRDILMLVSPLDVKGLNFMTKSIFDNAAAAIVGTVKHGGREARPLRKVVATTMFGETTPAATNAENILEAEGFDVLIFVPHGLGCVAMKEAVEKGIVTAVLNMTTYDVAQEIRIRMAEVEAKPFLLPAQGISRLEAIIKSKIPHIFVPGAMDIVGVAHGSLPKAYESRKIFQWSILADDVRANREEMKMAGQFVGERLNEAEAPTAVVFPKRGLSSLSREEELLHDPFADEGFMEGLKERLTNRAIKVEEVDAHIDDPYFAEVCVNILKEIVR
jgi:uncharacterized protein (UPF0261 family)